MTRKERLINVIIRHLPPQSGTPFNMEATAECIAEALISEGVMFRDEIRIPEKLICKCQGFMCICGKSESNDDVRGKNYIIDEFHKLNDGWWK